MQEPDKLHIDFQGRGKRVELYYSAGHSVLYSREDNLYCRIQSPATIDATSDELEKRDVFIPIRNFLESNPYKPLTDALSLDT